MSQSGLIDIEASHPQIPTSFTTDAGTAIPLANDLEILGTNGLTTSAAGKTVTITGITATSGATALAATKGVASFYSSDFTVVDGFVKISATFGGVQTILTDDGIPAVQPNGTGQVSILGGTGIDVTGQGPGNTITISGEDATTINKGITYLASDAQAIQGTLTSNYVINPSSLKAKLGVQTDHGIILGTGTATALAALDPGTTGQLLVSTTFADPSWSTTSYGDFSFTNITSAATPRMLAVTNVDVDAASHADLRLSTPPLGGDSCVSWEVQGSHFFSAGVDNQVAGDPWKLSNSSYPSAGTAAITVDATTAAITFASAYEFPIADGTANYPLVTDGAGNLDFTALTVAGGGTGATTLTDHSVLIGSGTGAITPITVGNTGEILAGNTGADPAFTATPTVTSINATTFDTNIVAAGVTLAGTTLAADGTDANIDINITPKGTGVVKANSVFTGGGTPTAVGGHTLGWEINDSNAGNVVFGIVKNTDNTDVNSHAQINLTAGGTSGGDPKLLYQITGGTSWVTGTDNSDSDKWKLSIGTVLGTNDVIDADVAGLLRYPLQSAFYAYNTSTLSNVTGDGTLYTVVFNTESYDQNNDFDGTSTFTIPSIGKYKLEGQVYITGLTAGHTSGYLAFKTGTGGTIYGDVINVGAVRDSGNTLTLHVSTQFAFAAADTVTLALSVSGSTKTISVGNLAIASYFTGKLVC